MKQMSGIMNSHKANPLVITSKASKSGDGALPASWQPSALPRGGAHLAVFGLLGFWFCFVLRSQVAQVGPELPV